MSFHTGYSFVIGHPVHEDEVDATISFNFYKGYPQTFDEPECYPEIELASCVVDGEDILDQLATWQVHNIESELLEGLFNDDDFDVPDKNDYDEEWSYNVA
jgi:hypothetical protein